MSAPTPPTAPATVMVIARRLIAGAALLVPRDQRDRWRREWNAEVVCWWRRAQGRRGSRGRLLKRALLSVGDAVVFRRLTVQEERRRRELLPSEREEAIMESFVQDLRFGLRSFAKKPALTLLVLLTLALGIGGNTAIFSLLHGIVLAPLPFPEGERMVQVWPTRDRGMSKKILERLQREATSYAWLASWSEGAFKLRLEDRAQLVHGPMVSAQYFQVLGAQPALGRLFEAGDDRRGPRHAVLSYPFWQAQYGGDPEILGKTLELTEEQYTIVGVAEPGLDLLRLPFDVALTHIIEADQEDYSANYMDVIGRLKPGVTVAAADAELRALALRWTQEDGITEEWAASASVISYQDFLVGDVKPTLYLLLGAVGFILLIVVANVANLLLARALSREQEIAVRSALGASGRRLARQLVTETTLLALLGGGLGLGVAGLALRGLKTLLPQDIPRLAQIDLAPEVLVFSCGLALLTGLVVGLVPAFSASRHEVRAGLGSGGQQTVSRSRRRLRSSLVVAEVTLAVVLLVGAGVLMRSFWNTVHQDPGFEAQGLYRFTVLPGAARWQTPEALEGYFQRLRAALEAVPGVEGVATVHAVPVVNGGWVMGTYPVESPPAEGEIPPLARWRPVSPEYFRLAAIDLLAGRPFSDLDTLEAEPVVILNRTAANFYFGQEDPLGQRMRIGFEGDQEMRVVGVVEDVRILGLRESAPLAAYRPYPQASAALHRIQVHDRSMMVRSTLPPERLDGPLRAAVTAFDPLANVLHLESMEQALATSLRQPRVVMLLLAVFAAVALLLGAVGIYGVMGYTVGERTREMGIRLALGAPVVAVLGTVMAGGLRLIVLGLVLGSGLALLLTRFLASQLFEVSPTDPLSLGAAAAVLLTVALIAIYLPARRAGKVDPVEVLRAE
jgi:putative ABC transport system permease protein